MFVIYQKDIISKGDDMIEVDARGLSCPLPVVKTAEAIKSDPEELKVLIDAREQAKNISRNIQKKGYQIAEILEEDDHFVLIIKKDK